MQYVGKAFGTMSRTWSSINPATLSGAIDVIVIEQANGDLACSPFHVRFGKFSMLRPSEKKVTFRVNNEVVQYSMKLGDEGDAFFVFSTESDVPDELKTSPVISPSSSPQSSEETSLQEPDDFDLSEHVSRTQKDGTSARSSDFNCNDDIGDVGFTRHESWDILSIDQSSSTPNDTPKTQIVSNDSTYSGSKKTNDELLSGSNASSPDLREARLSAIKRASELSKRLLSRDIPTHITDNGDVILDVRGYKSSDEAEQEAEAIARRILAEIGIDPSELENLISSDSYGNIWIYASEDSKEDAINRKSLFANTDIFSNNSSTDLSSKISLASAHVLESQPRPSMNTTTHVKTLRLTSEQLKSLNLQLGQNLISFSVNKGKATVSANLYFWKHNTSVVISDIDGTITKSDALGHVLTIIGKDWTHPGVAKLYSDIYNNGFNILYLTSRSVGQADSTREYLKKIEQNRYKLPLGPVILSPDRTIAALRREMILRKPEVFKISCLRDLQNVFGKDSNPFYAGFGNRITDALSYQSVGIPPTRIFTINSYGEVCMKFLELAGYRSNYISMNDLVDHFFPPQGMSLFQMKQIEFIDTLFWRSPLPHIYDSNEDDTLFSNDGDNEDDDDNDVDDDETEMYSDKHNVHIDF
ncbi:phosphatidate phosphatase PAH1 [Pneumocystis jirovecii RU7]|uniref:LNS2/PITP domain-containing protein n=1 Tax=Pneumocystis jirovecii (strain RU7) TaxID=1408657 RepID=A0A0W4ZSJ9_PNEJ7|nr:phosphatidate phosphatase PAH1 [Pneumocystis jirovecii RU7]KTW31326.1 hypothetical protein T551_01398 [Pneumocystis jirovecii RU7]